MQLLILTTDPTLKKWKSLSKKLSTIKTALDSGKNADFGDVEVIYVDTKPLVLKGRIDHSWLFNLTEPYFYQGYDIIGLHMSMAQWKEWGVQSSLRGANPIDKLEQEDFYFSADENSKRDGENRFVQVCLHEASHSYYQETKQTDLTHVWHSKNADISGLYKLFDWGLYQPHRMVLKTLKNVLESLVGLLRGNSAITPPTEPKLSPRLPREYNEYISQDYGVKSSAYPLTGRHIGVDYACPLGTKVSAPFDGEVIVSGQHASLGKFCYFQYLFEGKTRVERWMHLSTIPKQGKYKQGAKVALSGNTGFSTGPHFHVDGWWNEVNIGSINKANWSALTYNPHIKYV